MTQPIDPHFLGTSLDVRLNGDGAFDDVDPRKLAGRGDIVRAAILRNGTAGGRASIALLIRLDDGRLVVAETTYRLAYTAARAIGASPVAAEEVV